jgi:hypothetical protein
MPQDSVLGLVLYLLYTADLSQITLGSITATYAGDTDTFLSIDRLTL